MCVCKAVWVWARARACVCVCVQQRGPESPTIIITWNAAVSKDTITDILHSNHVHTGSETTSSLMTSMRATRMED